MTRDQLFAMKIERIKVLTQEAYETASLFNSFRHHQATMAYLDARAAARNAHALGEEIDALADKIAPVEQMMAAE